MGIERYYTVEQVAALLDLTAKQVVETVPLVKIGNFIRINEKILEEIKHA